MKNTALLFFCILGIQNAFAQNQPQQTNQTLENGVVIVPSKGVQSPNSVPFKANPVRTMEDWNLAECDQALSHIKEKIAAILPQDDQREELLAYYNGEQEKILKRKQTLIQTTK